MWQELGKYSQKTHDIMNTRTRPQRRIKDVDAYPKDRMRHKEKALLSTDWGRNRNQEASKRHTQDVPRILRWQRSLRPWLNRYIYVF